MRAVQILTLGVTVYQDEDTMLPYLQALSALDAKGELTAWCVASPHINRRWGRMSSVTSYRETRRIRRGMSTLTS